MVPPSSVPRPASSSEGERFRMLLGYVRGEVGRWAVVQLCLDTRPRWSWTRGQEVNKNREYDNVVLHSKNLFGPCPDRGFLAFPQSIGDPFASILGLSLWYNNFGSLFDFV